ncbi:MAG: tetratricopeptide repeat protein, partial [Candidatus Omnitrophica bacterium]|nr:tetratricopeptide repeat protein [Candidatus Omnitrophota bacterium]
MVKFFLSAILISFTIFSFMNSANAETDSELFSRGEKFFNNGEFDRAVVTFQTLIDKYPYSKFIPYAIYDQAFAFLETGEYPRAEANFKRISKDFQYLKDLMPKVQFGLAECYLRMGKDDLADSLYRAALSKDPSKAPDVIFSKAWAYYKQDKMDLAATFFKRMIEGYPADERALNAKFMLASIYKGQGRYKKAVDTLKTIPKDSRLGNDAYFNLGEIAFKVKN